MGLVKGRPIETGGGSGVPNPEVAELLDGEMTRFNETTEKIEGSGDINTDSEVSFGDKVLICKSVQTEPASVLIGGGIELSDGGGYLRIKSNMTGRDFYPIDYLVDRINGSSHPTYDERAILEVKHEVQGDFSQQMFGVTSYTINPVIDQAVSRVYFKLINPVTDFRAKVTSNVTGEILRWIPSKFDFDNGNGIPLGVGEQFLDVDAPIGETAGYPLTVEIFANESIDVLGDGVDIWRAVDRNIITLENIALERDFEGVIFKTDTSTADMQFVLGEDDMVSNSPTKIPTQQSVKAYVDNKISSSIRPQGGYDASTNTPNLETAPTGVLEGYLYVVTVAGTFFDEPLNIGDALISIIDDPQVKGDWIILQRNLDAGTVKVLYESNPDTNAFTDALLSLLNDQSGVNTGDQDLSGYALKSNVLELTNTSPYIPITDYHPSTKKYVDGAKQEAENRANHTGTQLASTISDFDTEVDNNPTVVLNTAKNTYPTADATKLLGIEPLAEVNQSDAEIKTQYEANADTNAYTDAEKTTVSNQSGTNTGDQDLSQFATKTQINNTTGYANYLDSSTISSPRSYGLNSTSPLMNDKAFPDGARYPDGVTSYWDAINSKFTPDQADGNYSFSVNFHVDATIRDKKMIITFVAIGAGAGGTDLIVQERLVRLQKDTGAITPISISFTSGITSAIIATGVSVILEFQDTGADVYDITCGLAKVGADII